MRGCSLWTRGRLRSHFGGIGGTPGVTPQYSPRSLPVGACSQDAWRSESDSRGTRAIAGSRVLLRLIWGLMWQTRAQAKRRGLVSLATWGLSFQRPGTCV